MEFLVEQPGIPRVVDPGDYSWNLKSIPCIITNRQIHFVFSCTGCQYVGFFSASLLQYDGVYRVAKGKVTLLVNDFARPNGIAFSPDEKYLYVNDTLKKTIRRFEVQPDGGIANGQVITDMNSDTRPGAPDGMKVDQKGNIYCTGPGGFWIMSPEGKHLATVNTKELPANLGWGDADGNTLYLTARTGLYRIRLLIPGVRP